MPPRREPTQLRLDLAEVEPAAISALYAQFGIAARSTCRDCRMLEAVRANREEPRWVCRQSPKVEGRKATWSPNWTACGAFLPAVAPTDMEMRRREGSSDSP